MKKDDKLGHVNLSLPFKEICDKPSRMDRSWHFEFNDTPLRSSDPKHAAQGAISLKVRWQPAIGGSREGAHRRSPSGSGGSGWLPGLGRSPKLQEENRHSASGFSSPRKLQEQERRWGSPTESAGGYARRPIGSPSLGETLGGWGKSLVSTFTGEGRSASLTQWGKLHLTLKEAINLKPADWTGKSDPYIRFRLNGREVTSSVKKQTLDTAFNEHFEFEGFLRELTTEPLEVMLYDKDVVKKDDDLGRTTVDLLQFQQMVRDSRTADGNWSQDYDCHIPNTQGSVIINFRWEAMGGVTGPPEIIYRDGLGQEPDAWHVKGKLVVELRRAVNLPAADMNGLSDPYAKLTIKGTTSRKKAEQKSKTIKESLNPVWNQTFSWEGTLAALTDEPLHIEVYDWDSIMKLKKDDFLGSCDVHLSSLLRTPELPDFAVPLRDASSGAASTSTTSSRYGTIVLRARWERDAYALPTDRSMGHNDSNLSTPRSESSSMTPRSFLSGLSGRRRGGDRGPTVATNVATPGALNLGRLRPNVADTPPVRSRGGRTMEAILDS